MKPYGLKNKKKGACACQYCEYEGSKRAVKRRARALAKKQIQKELKE